MPNKRKKEKKKFKLLPQCRVSIFIETRGQRLCILSLGHKGSHMTKPFSDRRLWWWENTTIE